jgi:hypothetical protein
MSEVTARPAALAGGASALLFLVGTAILNVPAMATNAELVQWWSTSSHQLEALVSMFSFTLAGLFFLVFLAHLRARLLAAEGGAGTLSTIVYSAGLLFVATLFVAAAARGVISYAVKSPAAGEPLPNADLLRYLPQVSYVVLGCCGLLSAALAVATTALLAFRTGVFGRSLVWLGVACAAAMVVSNVVLIGVDSIPAVLVWIVATSASLWRAGAGAPSIRAAVRTTSTAVLAAVAIGGLAGTAGAGANPGASCQAILSSADAQAQQRDDVSQFFAHELKDAFGVAPGVVYRTVAQDHAGTYADCAPTA